jgi:hypothetical protein
LIEAEHTANTSRTDVETESREPSDSSPASFEVRPIDNEEKNRARIVESRNESPEETFRNQLPVRY